MSSFAGKGDDMEAAERARLVNDTLVVFADLILAQRGAEIPGWVGVDLTVSQVRALYLLAYYETVTIGNLARALGIGNPAASVLVQQLVQRGLVERSEDAADRRRTFARLTRRGAELVGSRFEHREAQGRRWLARMSDDDLAALARGIRALVDIVRAEQSQVDQEA